MGSKNINGGDNGYCSSVCCMYAIKQAVMTRSHMTDGNGEQTIFYMDIRYHGKEYKQLLRKSPTDRCILCQIQSPYPA